MNSTSVDQTEVLAGYATGVAVGMVEISVTLLFGIVIGIYDLFMDAQDGDWDSIGALLSR